MRTYQSHEPEIKYASHSPKPTSSSEQPSVQQLVQRISTSQKPLQRKAAVRALQYKLGPKLPI